MKNFNFSTNFLNAFFLILLLVVDYVLVLAISPFKKEIKQSIMKLMLLCYRAKQKMYVHKYIPESMKPQ